MSARRPPLVGRYTGEELALAGRNRGMPLEALRHDVTPSGLHYLLIHFDIPPEPAGWKLRMNGVFQRPFAVGLDELKSMPSKTLRVTMECAGNGRAFLHPATEGEPWGLGAVGTAAWTGVSLSDVIDQAGPRAPQSHPLGHRRDLQPDREEHDRHDRR